MTYIIMLLFKTLSRSSVVVMKTFHFAPFVVITVSSLSYGRITVDYKIKTFVGRIKRFLFGVGWAESKGCSVYPQNGSVGNSLSALPARLGPSQGSHWKKISFDSPLLRWYFLVAVITVNLGQLLCFTSEEISCFVGDHMIVYFVWEKRVLVGPINLLQLMKSKSSHD